MQKIWNLNNLIKQRKDIKSNTAEVENYMGNFNSHIFKISNLIENFQFNVAVANIYELHKLMFTSLKKEINNSIFKETLQNFMKTLIPFTPHLAYECLEKLNISKSYKWPEIDKSTTIKKKIRIAIQVNGKTREILEVEKDINENELTNECKKNTKITKNLYGKEVIKTIFIKNRILNFLIK